jgi:zinc transporter ZupT
MSAYEPTGLPCQDKVQCALLILGAVTLTSLQPVIHAAAVTIRFQQLHKHAASSAGYIPMVKQILLLLLLLPLLLLLFTHAEGIAVGVPVYFATGSRMKAIWYAAISGAAEPVGALIGLAVHLSGALNLVAMGM